MPAPSRTSPTYPRIGHSLPMSMPSLPPDRSEEHTSELQSQSNIVCRLLLQKKKRVLYIIHFFFFNDTATTEIYTLSLHDAPPISPLGSGCGTAPVKDLVQHAGQREHQHDARAEQDQPDVSQDRP